MSTFRSCVLQFFGRGVDVHMMHMHAHKLGRFRLLLYECHSCTVFTKCVLLSLLVQSRCRWLVCSGGNRR
jgi:hypothetical protein